MVNKNDGKWLRPWNIEQFDDLYNRDERFFAILMKGFLGWMNNNVVVYNRSIRHFVQNTGSSYIYVENNGYEYSMNETSGEDMMYMQMPRCIVELGAITIPFEELTQPYSRGVYERRDGNEIKGYNAQMRRLPIEWDLTLKYVLSNFNEAIILVQELIDKLAFQQYFNITYLGQIIECAFEIPSDFNIEINKIDMTATEVNQKTIDIAVKITTNYPAIDERTEISAGSFIANYGTDINLFKNTLDNTTEVVKSGSEIEEKPEPKEEGHLLIVKPVESEDVYDNEGFLIKTIKYDELENIVGETLYDEEGNVTCEVLYDRAGHEIVTISSEDYERLGIGNKLGMIVDFNKLPTYEIDENYKKGIIYITNTNSYKIL